MQILRKLSMAWHIILHKLILTRYKDFTRLYWESRAKDIDEKWGKGQGDYELLSKIIDSCRATSILDLGCGSGRLFALYQEKDIKDVIGVDISARALKLANKAFPNVKTMRMKLEDIDFKPGGFDLAISNRVLQHIPRENIDGVIRKICLSSRSIYINELADTEGCESKYIFRYDYEGIFARYGFLLREKGLPSNQTWFLFSSASHVNSV